MTRAAGRAARKAWDLDPQYATKRTQQESARLFPVEPDDEPRFVWGDDGKLRRIRPVEPEPDDQDPRNYDPTADRRRAVERLFGDDTDAQPDDDDTPTWNPFTQAQADR